MVKLSNSAADKTVTYVIFETIKPEFRSEYEAWLEKINARLMRATGFKGVEVHRPKEGSTEYGIIVRFDTLANLKGWQLGPQAQALIEEARPYIEEVRTQYFEGLGMLFHQDVHARPPYWKQVVVSVVAVYPLVLLVGFVLGLMPGFNNLPQLLGVFISSVFISMLMVWPMLPLLTKALSKWLNS